MDAQSRNRTYLLCPRCEVTHRDLTTHLKRSCMKSATAEERAATLDSAKKEAAHLLKSGRVWEYSFLVSIMESTNPLASLIKELQDRGNAVRNIPPPGTPPPGTPATAATPPAPRSPAEVEEGSSEELVQTEGRYSLKIKVRKKMASAGLYRKHSLDHPLLKAFADHFVKDLDYRHCKQEVENVARFLYFMNPRRASLDFVKRHEKTREFFQKLSESGQKMQTVQNYMKSLKRFLKFHTDKTDLYDKDQKLHSHCRRYIDFLLSIQKGISKKVGKDVMKRRKTQESLSPRDCLAVLDAAKKDFLSVIGKLKGPEKSEASRKENRVVLYYLEALLVLKHLQRPEVVENMTVIEWKKRHFSPEDAGYCVVGALEHKTTTTQVATFALDQEEEMWFDLYFKEVRPELLCGRGRKLSSGDDGDDSRFFISSAGKPIHNCTNDIGAFQQKYNVPKVSSQMSQRAFKTATKSLTDAEISIFAEYLSISNLTAERDCRMTEVENVITCRKLINTLCGESDSSNEEQPSTSRHEASELATYGRFVQTFPITLDGTCPVKAERTKVVGRSQERPCYDRWRAEQRALRVQYVLEHFSHRLPNEKRIRRCMENQGWTTNIPDVQLIVQQWKPSDTVCTAVENPLIKKMVKTQKWKGLLVMDIPGKGRGVLTTRNFAAGEVVCDYHGTTLTHKEGLEIQKETEKAETGDIMFYKNSRGHTMCIDAREERCQCHPDLQTFGRLINHSADNPNVRPQVCSVEGKDVLLFFAIRDIVVDEELTFDFIICW